MTREGRAVSTWNKLKVHLSSSLTVSWYLQWMHRGRDASHTREGKGRGGNERENGRGGVDSEVQLLEVNMEWTTIHSIACSIQWENSCSKLTTPQIPHSTLTWAHACLLQQHLSHTEEADNLLSSQMCTEKTTHTHQPHYTPVSTGLTQPAIPHLHAAQPKEMLTPWYIQKAASLWRRLEHSGWNVGKVFSPFSSF